MHAQSNERNVRVAIVAMLLAAVFLGSPSDLTAAGDIEAKASDIPTTFVMGAGGFSVVHEGWIIGGTLGQPICGSGVSSSGPLINVGFWYPSFMAMVADASTDDPLLTRLTTIFPNPFNPKTTIAYTVAGTGRVRIAVFDIRGRLVNVLFDGVRSAGRYTVTWSGDDRLGHAVANGQYICMMQSNGSTQTQKMLLIR